MEPYALLNTRRLLNPDELRVCCLTIVSRAAWYVGAAGGDFYLVANDFPGYLDAQVRLCCQHKGPVQQESQRAHCVQHTAITVIYAQEACADIVFLLLLTPDPSLSHPHTYPHAPLRYPACTGQG